MNHPDQPLAYAPPAAPTPHGALLRLLGIIALTIGLLDVGLFGLATMVRFGWLGPTRFLIVQWPERDFGAVVQWAGTFVAIPAGMATLCRVRVAATLLVVVAVLEISSYIISIVSDVARWGTAMPTVDLAYILLMTASYWLATLAYPLTILAVVRAARAARATQ